MPYEIRSIAEVRTGLGESPLWCERTQSLWWLDAAAASPALWRFDGRHAVSLALPKLPAALALLGDGELLVAFRSRLAVLAAQGGWRWLDVTPPSDEERFNDARVDARGRLWIGTIDRRLGRPVGGLYACDAAHRLQCMDRGHTLSNGIAFSPDGTTLYFAETHERVLWRYPLDLDSGSLGPRSMVARWAAGDGAPDGITVDTDGGIWVALFGGGRVERLTPEGRVDLVLPLPVVQPTSCAFGGPGRSTLHITTAHLGLDETARAAQPLAGALLAVDLPWRGMPEHPWAGVVPALPSMETSR